MPTIREWFGDFIDEMDKELDRHYAEKGDSWMTMPIDDLRILFMDCYERFTQIADGTKQEFDELQKSSRSGDLVGVADGLADLIYVIYGAALEWGIPLDEVLREVHRSNMTKVWPDGKIHRRRDGKVLKPPSYSPADIEPIVVER